MEFNLEKRLLSEPYNFFLVAMLTLLVIPIFFWGESLGIRFYDTYFTFSNIYFIWPLAVIFLIGWTIYKLTEKILLTKYLIWIHVGATLITLFLLITTTTWYFKLSAPTEIQAILIPQVLNSQIRELRIASPIGIGFVIGQLAFIVNLVGGMIRRQL